MLNWNKVGLTNKKTKPKLLQIHPSDLKAEYLLNKDF